jgi:hypothetical protein
MIIPWPQELGAIEETPNLPTMTFPGEKVQWEYPHDPHLDPHSKIPTIGHVPGHPPIAETSAPYDHVQEEKEAHDRYIRRMRDLMDAALVSRARYGDPAPL